MEFELSFKNKRVKVWFALMVPSFILTIILFFYLRSENNYLVLVIPLIIGYLAYLGWGMVNRRSNK